MKVTQKNKLDAYHNVDITKKEYENCLYPLYVLGQGTTKDIVDYIQQPINRVSGRFSECLKKEFIHHSEITPSKLQDGYNSTNYVLTERGKRVVNEVQGNIQRNTFRINESVKTSGIFQPLLDVFGGV